MYKYDILEIQILEIQILSPCYHTIHLKSYFLQLYQIHLAGEQSRNLSANDKQGLIQQEEQLTKSGRNV